MKETSDVCVHQMMWLAKVVYMFCSLTGSNVLSQHV
jgi:hypothetical protein